MLGITWEDAQEPFGVMEIFYNWVISWLYRCKHLLEPIELYI